MNIISKIIYSIKNLFKKEEIKMIDAPKQNTNEEKDKFVNALKVNLIKKEKRRKIETLICIGDGLGIQKGISD